MAGVATDAQSTPSCVSHRSDGGGRAALVFVHGFTGKATATWTVMVDLLLKDPKLRSWDMFSLGYPSSLRVDIANLWAADPDIDKLAGGLGTTLSLPPFRDYERIALAAHSMGGLVVQRAILDNTKLAGRLSHVLLFGTPSGGLVKAGLLAALKRQFRDMASDSSFIKSLRSDWTKKFGAGVPFYFRVVAGDRDEFVPASSSVEVFPDDVREVVPGNHLEMVRPPNSQNQSYGLIAQALMGGSQAARAGIDGARMAVELGKFQVAVDTLLPGAKDLDDTARAILALALDGLGRGDEALSVLESGGRLTSIDARGVLGGRIKGRWLAGRAKDDFKRARELYDEGLSQAEASKDYEQAHYHGINVAFLDLMASAPSAKAPAPVEEMAKRVLEHCAKAPETHWRLASEGEAYLMLGQLDKAEERYRAAVAKSQSPREIYSMYSQAIRVAERMFGEDGVSPIQKAFGA